MNGDLNTGKGFTIVELIVVIVVIGILAAVALPRFLGLQDRAHDAVVEGTQSALASGVVMAKSVWLAEGRDSALDNIMSKEVTTCPAATCATGAVGLDSNSTGYPIGHTWTDPGTPTPKSNDAPMTATGCMEVFAFLLSESSVRATDTAAAAGTEADYAFEYVAKAGTGTPATEPTTMCIYSYQPDQADNQGSRRVIKYDTANGRVTVDNLSSVGTTST